MARVEIYTKFFCPYCSRAKALLSARGVNFDEIDITIDSAERGAMLMRSNGRSTVPQIFIDGTHIGGCDDLVALDQRGALDVLLGT